MAKMTREEAKNIAQRNGIRFVGGDFHRDVNMSQTDLLVELAKKTGYQKPANANGSRARYFYYHLRDKVRD